MVSIHSLEQVEETDVHHLRELEESIDLAQNLLQTSQTQSQTSATHDTSTPRRPLTRSQTGHASKRKLQDDSPVRATATNASSQRKRTKAMSNSMKQSSQPADDPEQTEDEPAPESATLSAVVPLSRSVTPAQQEIADNRSSEPLSSFNNSSDEANVVRCTPRSRVVLPVPVPNLTKKSRGRRVPTTSSPDLSGSSKDERLYVCKVEGCGKCFHRGEHLKRHIRSIHTHEKPFKCTFSMCEKYFNRHDNLLQHLKVHREPSKQVNQDSLNSLNDADNDNDNHDTTERVVPVYSSSSTSSPSSSTHPSLMTSPFMDHYQSRINTLPYNTSARFSVSTNLMDYSYPQTIRANLISTATESPSFSTSMAVSSIRTEIPTTQLLQATKRALS
ncbi:hypothetical protein AMATHDRAFT_184547 [Amanita thiersii Skay4041]|uniref:C2H2-type domain-containing protein n=1 Tax=Amanita thiersii Skay4041 TaxID=703135 RepID=A0A2A9N8P2_9AGAR|nr:hypothetical protein AMATHDRAFT_184547 [Amanita thiersii Skay4041]